MLIHSLNKQCARWYIITSLSETFLIKICYRHETVSALCVYEYIVYFINNSIKIEIKVNIIKDNIYIIKLYTFMQTLSPATPATYCFIFFSQRFSFFSSMYVSDFHLVKMPYAICMFAKFNFAFHREHKILPPVLVILYFCARSSSMTESTRV